jgi:threonine/homoserine/homoserine lactone efflux protein
MQDYLALIVATLVISPSGALSPGPLTVACIAEGTRGGWKAGIEASLGHMIVEVPYTLALVLLASRIVLEPGVHKLMSILSSSVMVFFGYLILKDSVRGRGERVTKANHKHRLGGRPLFIGLLFTGLNPYFLLWWVGAAWPMVSGAAKLLPLGYLVMYMFHIWYDYAWLGLMSLAGERGARLLSGRGYRVLLGLLAALLFLFAASMVSSSLFNVRLLPF